MLKAIIGMAVIIIVLSFAVILLPLAIGVIVAIIEFYSGNIVAGIIAIVIGIAIQIIWAVYIYNGEGPTAGETEECPYCGSGDTDGSYCYNCDDDF